jgi:hypothetical protein
MLMNILPRHFLCFPDYTERDWPQACDFPGQHTRSLRGYQLSLYQQAAERVDSRIGRSVDSVHAIGTFLLRKPMHGKDDRSEQPVKLQREGFIPESAEYRQVASFHRKPTMRV